MSFSDTHAFGDRGGCALSVFVPAIATASVSALFMASGDPGFAAIAFLVAFLVSLVVIGLSALVIGLPLTRLFESNGWERPWSYPLAGFVFGGIIMFLVAEASGSPNLWSEQYALFLLTGALPGLLCGALWWWFERRHRQDDEPGPGS